MLHMKKIVLYLFVFYWGSLQAQHTEPKQALEESRFQSLPSPPLMQKALYKVLAPKQADMRFDPKLLHPVSNNESEHPSELLQIKAAKDYLKKFPYAAMRNSPHAESPSGGAEILVGNSFYGDIDGACPNDNTIAISKAGRIVSMMNDYVGIYSTGGTKLNNYTLSEFFNGLLPSSICDPKVQYDPVTDRFFMYIQECNNDPQYIAFGFSQSNNPNGNWNIYLFDSDAFGDGSWTDYPKVAINESEVFVTMNLFGRGSSGGYKQSIMYQLNKSEGYAGATLHYKIWSGFQSGTILPIRSGANGLYGPGIYAVQGAAYGSDYFYLYDITGSLSDPNARLLATKVITDPYEPSGNAYQLGTSTRLDIGDCRFQDGYYQNGIIHFVFAADDQGFSGIRYHRLDPSKINGKTYDLVSSSDLRDYCYPSIEPFANGTDNSAIVHFTSSGENHYPDMRAKLYFHDFSSDPSIRIKVGLGPVTSCYSDSRKAARWGDYSGIARHYGKTNPTVWIAGSVGSSSSGIWWTYISELYSSPTATENLQESGKIMVQPNPADDRISLHITVHERTDAVFNLSSGNGEFIGKLYDGILFPGENTFSFSTQQLNNGIYFLNVQAKTHEVIKPYKVVVQR